MTASDVDIIIDEIQRLARNLDTLPEISDADMALMYLRHLRQRRASTVPIPG